MESTIQLTLNRHHLHLLLCAARYLPPGPDATAVEQLLQAALSPIDNSLPTPPRSPSPILITPGDDIHGAATDAEINRELLALIGEDSEIESRECDPISMQDSDQEVNVDMDDDTEINRELLSLLGEEPDLQRESPDPLLSSGGALASNLFQPTPPCPRGGKRLQKHAGLTVSTDTDANPSGTADVPTAEPRFLQTANTAPSGNHTAQSCIASLAGACIDRAAIWAEELKLNMVEWQHTVGDSLPAMVRRCQNTTCSNFAIILGHIQLVMKCQRQAPASVPPLIYSQFIASLTLWALKTSMTYLTTWLNSYRTPPLSQLSTDGFRLDTSSHILQMGVPFMYCF